jgi:hypothetical protein
VLKFRQLSKIVLSCRLQHENFIERNEKNHSGVLQEERSLYKNNNHTLKPKQWKLNLVSTCIGIIENSIYMSQMKTFPVSQQLQEVPAAVNWKLDRSGWNQGNG